ncbi:MAG TPA: AraC family transcriptional regulator, partial [Usitatibacter sp.]|nr:AraC family transcriptional regulator [Usitatibacter sp.]
MRPETWRLDTAGRTARGRVLCLIGRIAADPAPWPGVLALAECAAVTVRTLSRAFARETGMSPARFLERSRVRLACSLLEERAWRRWLEETSAFLRQPAAAGSAFAALSPREIELAALIAEGLD